MFQSPKLNSRLEFGANADAFPVWTENCNDFLNRERHNSTGAVPRGGKQKKISRA